MIETHCHLDYLLKDKELSAIVLEAQSNGVEKIITISVAPDNMDMVKNIAESHPCIYFTQGIHPHEASSYSQEVENKIYLHKDHPKMVAVGEIGLDYYYHNSPAEIQRDVFSKQLAIAAQINKPVVIHSRDADDDMIKLLEQHKNQLQKKGVIHSFSSSLKLLDWAVENNFYIGFNGMVTFKKAQNIVEAVERCPISHILFETDAPYLTPVPHRGKTNYPLYLPLIAQEIAKIKGIDHKELCQKVKENSKKLFNLP